MQVARMELGLGTDERAIDRTELYVADEIFLCGTGAQIAPVVEVDNRKVGGTGTIGPITQRLMKVYNAAVRGDDARFRDWVMPVYKS
jgi:branched-chain amino acid aminotransferase